jgi:hypothetical protein
MKEWEPVLPDERAHLRLEFVNLAEMKGPQTEAEHRQAREANYRRGYRDGVRAASDAIADLYRSGFGRPSEIENILDHWHDNDLTEWARDGWISGFRLAPGLKCDTWSRIRRRIIARDGKRCVWCSSVESLQVDHIKPVSEGGLPTADNLRTLCCECHKNKKRLELQYE